MDLSSLFLIFPDKFKAAKRFKGTHIFVSVSRICVLRLKEEFRLTLSGKWIVFQHQGDASIKSQMSNDMKKRTFLVILMNQTKRVLKNSHNGGEEVSSI